MSICNMEDDILVEKLRKENYDQFTTLVRMHLSFVLDLNTDEWVKINFCNIRLILVGV